MASIINNTKQIEALNAIQDGLERISALDSILHTPDAELVLQAKCGKGRPVKVDVTDETRKKVLAALETSRDRLAKDITSKASKFAIQLDDSDLACLRGASEVEQEKREKQDADVPDNLESLLFQAEDVP